ncbi:MAG: hypothetical protein E7035_06990 [Verrucomicrobiaceae bacterium]|nr:hypothetical protein [Verrucomicrobiaceae bacterium]
MKHIMKKLLILSLLFIVEFTFAKSIEVASFYYPNWHANEFTKSKKPQNWTQWQIVKNAKPFYKGHHQPKHPYLNYLNSANPKHVSMEIDLAKDNGVDIFIYNWHWYNGSQIMQEGLEQGFLKAPNNEKMKFAIMWDNQDLKPIWQIKNKKQPKPIFKAEHSETDTLNVINYCIKNYFNKPNYWKVNGKFYVSLTSPIDFINKIGGIEKTKKLFEKIDATLQKANLPKIHWAGNCASKEDAKILAIAGFSSTFIKSVSPCYFENYKERVSKANYSFDYSELITTSKNIWCNMATSALPNIPTITQGFDTSPLCKQKAKYPFSNAEYPYLPIVQNNTSDKFEELVKSAKNHIEKTQNAIPVVFVSSWNNWNEGNAIFPEKIEGMNFLRAIGRVFNPDSKTLTFASIYIKDKICQLPQPDARLNYAKYGKNAIDFWKAKNGKSPAPTVIYYHGGGWANNCNLDLRLIKLFKLRDMGFNIAAVSYRFTHEVNHKIYPPVKAPMQDCANALALIVEKAKELGVDTSRISLTGGSAGACSSLWIALNTGKKLDSGRIIPQVKMISVVVPQTSLDPVQMRDWIPNSHYGAHAFNLKNFNEFLQKRDSILETINQYSPYALLSPEKNKIKLYLVNRYKPEVNQKVKDPTHASAFCIKFKEKCDELKIPCEIIFNKKDWETSIENIKNNL